MAQRKRLELNGVFNEPEVNFEMWETQIYIYTQCQKGVMSIHCSINVPIDIVRHLELKHKDRIIVAIKKIDAEICELSDKGVDE